MSANASGARSPETINATLSRVGAQLSIKLTNGATYFGDVVHPPQRDGHFKIWLWGCSAPTRMMVADVVIATGANITLHAEFSAIRQRQRRELDGGTR